MIKKFLAIFTLLSLLSCAALAGGGGEVKSEKSVGDFDIKIDQIPLTKPTDNVEIRVVVSEKEGTNERVSNASVLMEVTCNEKCVQVIPLNETDKGVYTGLFVRNHTEFWGSEKISIDVRKDGKEGNIRAVAPYMQMDPWMYAIFCLISAYIFGYGASIIFGSIKH